MSYDCKADHFFIEFYNFLNLKICKCLAPAPSTGQSTLESVRQIKMYKCLSHSHLSLSGRRFEGSELSGVNC